ncbi:hypothetical protein BGZ99_001646 [Dissophora globulifera]|uniref:Uncharacterized protein n=1 Tax=Dissophora globulifera TaxID=979702 RepID=A0A9P6RNK9_9FUNG|nr:hypothetical protein BGZ99_001646 [Dissophora globulifera]
MTVPQTTPTSALPSVATATSTTDKSGSNSSHTNSGPIKPGALSPTTTPTPTTTTNQITSWNVVPTPTLASTEPQLESLTTPQKHTSSIGWADVKQGAGPTTLNNRILSEPSSSSSEGSQRQQMAVQTTTPEFSRQGHAPGDNGIGTSQTTSSSSANRQHERQSHLEESVSPATLLAHLRLLRLVQSLVIIEDEDLDFLFLIRSEERYMMYLDLLEQLQPPADAVPLPPLDVALMWTVHMLAPFRYHEDLVRSYSPHLLNYTFPLERYVASVDIEDPATIHEAFGPSKEMWHQLYPEEAFDLDKNDTNQMFEIRCLWCGGTNVMDSSTYIKFRIDGVAIDCAGCGSQCSLETLSSKRLWDSVEAYRANSSVLLAGSLLSPWTGTPDTVAAQREHHHLFFHPRIQFALDQASVSLNCTWPKVIQAFQDLGPDQYYGIRPTTLARIMSSYMGLVEDRLSMDLVAGALRQRDFQKAMMVTGGLAWCQPQVLHRSLERYKKFMLLARAESKHTSGGGGVAGVTMTAPGGGNLGAGQPGRHALVPTLDIDLAWHTHMLSPDHYRQYQLAHFGCVLNHDDTVQATSTMTKQDFVRTAELWQALYQERYSSQQMGKSKFVMTPKKLWAGICFPPYGAYLAWKSWKSKRKAKKLNKAGASMTGSGWGSESKSEKGKKLKEKKKSKKEHARDREKGSAANAGDETASKKRKGKSVKKSEKIDGLTVQHESPVQRPSAIDLKGKSKADNGAEGIPSVQGKATATSTENLNKNMAPGLGLDGRLSNWNGDAAGPDGQASCASGACIMSPWNELQELVPYIDLQPQQQRELRRERT